MTISDQLRNTVNNCLDFDRPALYDIKIQGRVPVRMVRNLGALHHEILAGINDKPITFLQGHFANQPRLQKLLYRMLSAGFPILSVVCVNYDGPPLSDNEAIP